MNEEQLYDLSSLKAISRGNEAFIQKMVNIFCEQTPGILKEIETAYNTGDFEAMGAAAHKMKPSIDNLNIVLVKDIIREIENSGKHSAKNATLPEKFIKINSVINKVIDLLKEEYPG